MNESEDLFSESYQIFTEKVVGWVHSQ